MFVTRPEESRKRHARAVSRGAEKWLRIAYHNTPAEAVPALHAAGYRVLTSRLSPDALPLAGINFAQPTALVFGTNTKASAPSSTISPTGASRYR